jgi:hypothetical protein
VQEEPIDPFNGDPADPAAGLDDLTEDADSDPLTEPSGRTSSRTSPTWRSTRRC